MQPADGVTAEAANAPVCAETARAQPAHGVMVVTAEAATAADSAETARPQRAAEMQGPDRASDPARAHLHRAAQADRAAVPDLARAAGPVPVITVTELPEMKDSEETPINTEMTTSAR